MTQFILFLLLFPFCFDIIAASPRNNASLSTASPPRIKFTFSKTGKLQKFAERLEKGCNFDHLDDVDKDLKGLWAKVMKEEEHASKDMIDEQNFLKKIIELYNNCSEQMGYIDFERQWEIYWKIFGKEYATREKEMRKEIFKQKMEYVRKHNELYRKGSVSYATEEELKKKNGCLPASSTSQNNSERKSRYVESLLWKYYFYNSFDMVPTSVDWRTQGYVTPVKNQGSCGSCYAIAGLGALEAYHKKRTGGLVILSTQNILDCTWHLGNQGCTSGYHEKVLEYAESTGVMLNSRYPYTMNASHNCRWRREDVVTTARGYYVVERDSELALRNAVAGHGTVAVGMGSSGLGDYRYGIFDPYVCGPADHSALVVGYGTDPWYGDFWIVRSCWGFWWGEDGYVRIARNKNNICQIASYAFFPY